jgi:hypothetical protein
MNSQVKNTLIDFGEAPYAQREHSDRLGAQRRAEALEGGGSQMRTQMTTGVSWAAACVPSFVTAPAFPLPDGAMGGGTTGRAYVLVDELLVVNGARQRDVQRVQVEQGMNVVSGISPIAPMAHKAANKAGETGPYPWRQPV